MALEDLKLQFSLYSDLVKQILDSALLHYGTYVWSWDVVSGICSAFGYGEYEVSSTFRSCRILLICPASIRSLGRFFSLLSQVSCSPHIKLLFSRKSTGLIRRPPTTGYPLLLGLHQGYTLFPHVRSSSYPHSYPEIYILFYFVSSRPFGIFREVTFFDEQLPLAIYVGPDHFREALTPVRFC
jgi:hypothetical protein